jgi:GNAT superfamily N-acetyltransferase
MNTIRRATFADADAILALTTDFATTFPTKETAWRASFAEIVAQPDAVLLVAESDGHIAGYLLGFDHPTLYANGRTAWVDELAVAEAHRRSGLGRLLMRAFEDWARERGCVLVSLATRRAGDFYAAIGYEDSADYYRLIL